MITMRIRRDGAPLLDWISTFDVPQVPDKGDLVSVDGLTYIVVGRSWAFDKKGSLDRSFCHIIVQPAEAA
jgi:hypothetical protein